VSSCNAGEHRNLIVSLYNEREVERVAWKKYGGPEQFDHQCVQRIIPQSS
jgi:hypothetical protein